MAFTYTRKTYYVHIWQDKNSNGTYESTDEIRELSWDDPTLNFALGGSPTYYIGWYNKSDNLINQSKPCYSAYANGILPFNAIGGDLTTTMQSAYANGGKAYIIGGNVPVYSIDGSNNITLGTVIYTPPPTLKTLSSITRDPIDHKIFYLTLTDPILLDEVPKLGYTKGDIVDEIGLFLANFNNLVITNNAVALTPTLLSLATNTAGTQIILTLDKTMANPTGKQGEFSVKTEAVNGYQTWTNHPTSPLLSSDYPYQCIVTDNSSHYSFLCMSNNKFFGTNAYLQVLTYPFKLYSHAQGVNTWTASADRSSMFDVSGRPYQEANYNVYTDSTFTTVFFTQTTSSIITTNITISSVALDTDNKKIVLSLASSIANGVTVKASYAGIDVATVEGGKMDSFTDLAVVNNVPFPYQKWTTYMDSPVSLTDYPYQYIGNYFGAIQLYVAKQPIYRINNGTNPANYRSAGNGKFYALVSSNWQWQQDFAPNTNMGSTYPPNSYLLQANNPIYTDSTLTTVYFAKTTP